MQASIRKCGSCGKSHDSVEVHPYRKVREPWTHWYSCPETGDAEPLALVVRDQQVTDIKADVVDSLVEAEQSGNYLVAIFFRRGDKLNLRRTTQNFAKEDFERVVEDLKKNLSREVEPPEQQELAEAEAPAPAVQLFRKSE